ncbi:MAG: beta-ketoacyl-[acyl-carrier-protein] synthase family protein [Lachnospiraceae bacterium]|nr:beta-ketoacyl-[acyl-carrier-protein] synthase family protein [Lachnospiraceae bacterium]MBP5564580.1 beta-ketoacyl-[acyl-carrier-protein] synthase family protein [Lachnospiraceae bacterium]
MSNINARCVVTGLGMINAIGKNVDECWENALKGTPGIDRVKSVNSDDCYAHLGAEVKDSDIEMNDKVDRVSMLCLQASKEALKDANLTVNESEAGRFGVIMGSCVGGVVSIENYIEKGEKTEDINKMTIASIANHVANMAGAKGVVTNIGNACAASTMSVAYACELIRAGVGDVFIAGGADAFASVPFAGFTALHALSENPCSPFNHSNGITLGEGAGAIIVESYEHAKARGAKIYCDVLSAGISSDAHHITAPRPDGIGQMYAIRRALDKSGVKKEDLDYINAHGTGTAKNDEAEFLSIHTIFDDVNDHLSVSSTKAMVGHCLGAAGAIEAVYAIKALTDNKVPPTIGYTAEDLEALKEKAGKIDFMPNDMKEKEMNYVMSNSFAFGGSNASIIFSKNESKMTEEENNESIYVTGMGIVLPSGNGVENYIETVKNKKTAEGVSLKSELGKEDFDKFDIKLAFYRKLDKLSTMQVVSGIEAINNAGFEFNDDNAEDFGMIIGTGDGPLTTVYEFQDHISKEGTQNGSAFNFPNTVYNAAGGYLSIKTGMRGYNVTVTNGSQSGLSSVCYAANEIKQSRTKVMLASGSDENSDIMNKLYSQLNLLAKEQGGIYDNEKGMTLSDGSVTVALESASQAASHNAKKYAEVVGYAMTHEGVEYGEVKGSDAGLKNAIDEALKDAGITADKIDAVFGFGNGLKDVDDIEKNVYAKVFANEIPVINVKDYAGEARAAAATLAFAHASLTLAGELGTSQDAYLMKDGNAKKGNVDTTNFNYVLVTSYAVGGSYTAVVLKKVN